MSILDRTDLRARMVQGAAMAACTAVFTSLGASMDSHPVTSRMLVIGCSGIAGALAGIVYFATEPIRAQGGWRRTSANVGTLLAFCAFTVGIVVLAVQIPLVREAL